MSKDDQSALLMTVVIIILISFTLDVIGSAGKAWHAFYHQVILKDEVAGQVHQK